VVTLLHTVLFTFIVFENYLLLIVQIMQIFLTIKMHSFRFLVILEEKKTLNINNKTYFYIVMQLGIDFR